MICKPACEEQRGAQPDLFRQIERTPFEYAVGRDDDIRRHQTAESHQYDKQQEPHSDPEFVRRIFYFAVKIFFRFIIAAVTSAASSSAAIFIIAAARRRAAP